MSGHGSTWRRVVGAAAVVAVAVGLAAASAMAGPVTAPRPMAQPLNVSPRTAPIACPGPEGLTVPQGAQPVAAGGPVQLALAVAAAAPGAQAGQQPVAAALVPLSRKGKSAAVAAQAGGAGVSSVVLSGPVALTARTPAYGAAPLTGGLQTTVARSGDVRGLVGVACSPATTQAWLVGSGTGQGRRARLLVANPSASAAIFDVRVLTPKAAVDPANAQGVLVPARSQVALLVDALVPGADGVAVRVQARQGRVVAVLQDNVLRGLVPGGIDDVGPGADPARSQVVPGLDVHASPVKGGAARLPADPSDPGAVAVRVAVPGSEDAVVHVRLVGSRGALALPAGVVTVPAGTVADVPVTGVPDGVYSAMVEADVPVVAGAVVGRAVAGSELAGTPDGVAVDVPPAELSWAASTAALQTSLVPSLVPLPPPGTTGKLALVAPGKAGVVALTPVSATGAYGKTGSVSVPAGRTLAVALPSGAAAVLLQVRAGSGPVHAALDLEAADRRGAMVSVLSVQPSPSTSARSLPVVEQPALH